MAEAMAMGVHGGYAGSASAPVRSVAFDSLSGRPTGFAYVRFGHDGRRLAGRRGAAMPAANAVMAARRRTVQYIGRRRPVSGLAIVSAATKDLAAISRRMS